MHINGSSISNEIELYPTWICLVWKGFFIKKCLRVNFFFFVKAANSILKQEHREEREEASENFGERKMESSNRIIAVSSSSSSNKKGMGIENPFSLKVGQVFTGFGVGCGLGIGVGRPLNLGWLVGWLLPFYSILCMYVFMSTR